MINTFAPDPNGDEDAAMVAVAAMVGALTLSRVMTDAGRSDAMLRAVKTHLAGLERPVWTSPRSPVRGARRG